MNKKYELLMNGTRYLFTMIPDSVKPDRDTESGIMHLVLPGPLASSPETVVGDFAYNELTFQKIPFFDIKPVK